MNAFSLSFEEVTVKYGKHIALDKVSCSFPSGKLCAIVGPNGAGKSTLLKTALGLVHRQRGEVRFASEKVTYVPQRLAVDWNFPITVGEVVMMGLWRQLGWFGRARARHHSLVDAALERSQIADLKTKQISDLSGGQQQRVFIARSLVEEHDIYLFDEPFTGVDVKSQRVILEILHELASKNKSIIVVHHDLAMVHEYFQHAVMLNTQLVASGEPRTIEHFFSFGVNLQAACSA